MLWTDRFASEERQKVLRDAGIAFTVDQDLSLGFYSDDDVQKAYKVLKATLEW